MNIAFMAFALQQPTEFDPGVLYGHLNLPGVTFELRIRKPGAPLGVDPLPQKQDKVFASAGAMVEQLRCLPFYS